MDRYQFKSTIKFFNEQHDIQCSPEVIWTKNTKANWDRFGKHNTIWNLKDCFLSKEKAVVVVGASPRLKEDVHKLKGLNRGRFCIIVVNSALKFLLENDVIPDYVMAIDGDPTNLVGHLDVKSDDLTLLTSNSVAPEIFDKWKGKSYWIPYYAVERKMRKDLNKKLGKSVPCGGNTFTTALATAAVVFGARIFIMVGSELCYDDQYYVDKKSHWDDTNEMRWKVIDVNGRERWTNIPLFQYKIWTEKMAKDLPQCRFIDTSFGIVGTDCDQVSVMDLTDAIRKVNAAFDVVDGKDWHEIEKMRYDAAYATMKYIPTQGFSIWNSLFEMNDIGGIKTVLDVGCGIGQCVADGRNRGLMSHGIDITEKAKWFWDEANISKFCDVAPADKIPFPDKSFDLVFCTEVLEHVPEEGIPASFAEMYRVGKGDFIFSIALAEAVNKMPNDGSEPHICLKPVEWWLAQMKVAGYKICGIKYSEEAKSLIVLSTRSDHNDKDLLRNGCLHIQPKRNLQLSGDNLNVANGG